ESPALLVAAPERSLAVDGESTTATTTATAPAMNPPVAVVVIDAVSVPPEPTPVIPVGDLSGRFVVTPSQEHGVGSANSIEGGERLAVTGAPNAKPPLPSHLTNERGTVTQTGSVHDTEIAVVKDRPAGIAILGGSAGRNGKGV